MLQGKFPGITSLPKGEPIERRTKVDIGKVRQTMCAALTLPAVLADPLACPSPLCLVQICWPCTCVCCNQGASMLPRP